MEYELYEMEALEGFDKALESYKHNLNKISAGRANPAVLNGVKVEYYGSLSPLNEVASISTPEPRQLLIKPFDQSINRDIVAAINSSSLGLNAVDEGDKARITIPDLTTERRRELVKSFNNYTEQARVQVRLVRQNINKDIKKDEELTEDDERNFLERIQKLVDKYNAEIESITDAKEKELMSM